MPAGRPPLDPKVKHEHVNASRKRYDEKKRAAIAASDFKTRWRYREKAASDSERYRDRKNAELRTEAARADAVKRCARKMEAKELRKQSLKKHAEKPTAATPTAVPSSKKARRLTRLQSECGAAPEQNDLANEDSDDELRACRVPAPATFEGGITARTRSVVSLRCADCDCDGCPGCACMCPVSEVWIEHEGGHFFPTCKACNRDDCPGCKCTCPKSKVLTEHGGHLRTKIALFNSP
ncbi:hypothetical protein C8R44DRAFT_887093 [Mycena epipterygia]|nr:hypothetical protein C8R44DRAFT_887093 [Mycena epipterygia]